MSLTDNNIKWDVVRSIKYWTLAILILILITPMSFAREPDSRVERVYTPFANDTFASIVLREFGQLGLSRSLAEYNRMPINTVFTENDEIRIPTHLAGKENAVSVIYHKGEAYVRPAGSRKYRRKLQKSDKLHTSDEIETGNRGFVSLAFQSGSVVNVQPFSHVRLKTLQCLEDDPTCDVELEALKGGLESDVKRNNGQSNQFTITTPYASAAVRGTAFDVDVSEASGQIGVTEGLVDVLASNLEVPVPEGYGIAVVANQTGSDLIALLRKPSIYATPTRVSEQDRLHWEPLAGAKRYSVTLSEDASGQQVLQQQDQEDFQFSFENMPINADEFFLSVRGVDAFKLKGLKQSVSFRPVRLNGQQQAAELISRIAGNIVQVDLSGPQSFLPHEVQWSSDPEFKEVVTVDVPGHGGINQPVETGQRYFVRARALLGPKTVSPYSDVLIIATTDTTR